MSNWDGAAYDRWLEAPYVEAAQREAAFETFCESHDVDPNADDAYEQFDAYEQEQYESRDFESMREAQYDNYDY